MQQFEEEKHKTFIITSNMTRQYKLMRDELMKKNDEIKYEKLQKETELGKLLLLICYFSK